MNNSELAGGCLSTFMFIGAIASWIGSGIIFWNWINPDGFLTAVMFLITWGILGKIFDILIGLITMGLASALD